MSARALRSFAALVLAVLPASVGQSDERVTRWLDYLATNPYHERAFEGLVEAALAGDGLAPLLDALARRDDDAARVLRARLHARTGELERALVELASVAEPTAETHALEGELYLRDGQHDAALRAFDEAVSGLASRERLETVHRLRAEAHMASGDAASAAAALSELAELDPLDATAALDVARRLSDWRLYDAALAQYRVAEARAVDDASRRCEALFERGRVHERLGQLDAAFEAWEAALAGVGRGHWLAERVEARILAAHERVATLATYVRERAAAVDAAPRDLRARERLAAALAAQGDPRAALEVTAPAARDHPGDRRLNELRRALFAQSGDTDGAIAELQHALERAPSDRALRVELGELFLRAGRPDACEREWRVVIDDVQADPAEVRALAARWAEAGELARAVRAFERAIELEPLELRGHDELASVLARAADAAGLEAALLRAEAAQPDAPAWLDAVAGLRRRHRHLDVALRLLRRADELEPDRPERLRVLGELLAEHGARQESSAVLHRLIEVEHAPGARARAAERLVRGLRDARELRVWIGTERAAIAADAGALAPRWVLAELHLRVGEPAQARDVYAELVALEPDDIGARLALADACERSGDAARALEEYGHLIGLAPERARELRAKSVSLLLELGARDDAAVLVRASIAAAPDDAAGLRAAAEWFARLGFDDETLDALARATRIEPERADARLAYAERLAARGELVDARRELEAAHRNGDAAQRAEAIERMCALAPADELQRELDVLLARIAAETGAAREARLAVDLALASDERARDAARAALEQALARSPFEPALIEARAHLLALSGDHDGAIAAFEALALDPDRDPEASLYDHLAARLASREPERALALARRAQDPVRAARLFVQAGFARQATALLAATPKRTQQRALALQLLAELAAEAGDLEQVVAALAERLELVGEDVTELRRLGEAQAALGRHDAALATGRRLLELAGESPATEEYFARLGFASEYLRLRAERILRHPEDEAALRTFFEQVLREDAEEAVVLELVDGLRRAARDEGRRPERHGARSWDAFLDQLELDFFATRLELAQQRLVELSARLERGERLSESEWSHVLHHQRMGSEIRERERVLFQTALAQHPRSSVLRSVVAHRHRVAREYAAAAEHLLVALELREAPERMADEAQRKRNERDEVWIELRALLAPRGARLDLDAPAFSELAVRLMRTVVHDRTLPRYEPELAELVRHAGLCLARAGREAEARTLLRELEPADDDRLPELEYAAEAWLEAGFEVESARVVERVLAHWRALACRPECTGWDEWLARSRHGLERVALRRWNAGDAVGAVLLLRRAGAVGPAYQLVVERGLLAELLEALAMRLDELERALAGAALERAPEPRDLTLFRAELLELDGRGDEARALLAALAARTPEDPLPHRARAGLELRALDLDAATRARRAAQALERERRLALLAGGCDDARVTAQPFDELEVVRAALATPSPRAAWQAVREPADSDPDRALVADSLALAELAAEVRRPADVVLALAPLMEERVPAASFVAPLLEWLRALPSGFLGEHEPDVLRVACAAPGADVAVLAEFVEALLRRYRIEEARAALAAFAAARAPLAPMEEKHLGVLDARVRAVETDGR